MAKRANSKEKAISEILKKGIPSPIPHKLSPMLASLASEAFNSPDWFYEVKWDGYRTIAYAENGSISLSSRNQTSFTQKYYPVKKAFEDININAVFDGEIIVQDPDGRANFNALQNWNSEKDSDLVMYVFDLLWYNGVNLMNLPVTDRKSLLKEILPENPVIKLSESFDNGKEFFHTCSEFKLEGIVAKKKTSAYRPGERTKSWLKIKCNQLENFYIGGYTINEGIAQGFSALLLGVNDNGILKYVGKVGTGFPFKLQKDLLEIFKLLIIPESPFQTVVDIDKPTRFNPRPPKAKVFWLKPELICQVAYTEYTNEGILRHPSFKGLVH